MHMNSSILYCELVAVWLSDVIIRTLLARSTGYYEKGGWLPYCPASMPLPQSQRAGKYGRDHPDIFLSVVFDALH